MPGTRHPHRHRLFLGGRTVDPNQGSADAQKEKAARVSGPSRRGIGELPVPDQRRDAFGS